MLNPRNKHNKDKGVAFYAHEKPSEKGYFVGQRVWSDIPPIGYESNGDIVRMTEKGIYVRHTKDE